ncbi:MAG: type II secretion system protein [Bacilli bacterium]
MEKEKGFTLIELLAVIALLGIIVTMAVPNVLKIYNKAQKKAFDTQVDLVKKAGELYFQDYCEYPIPGKECALKAPFTGEVTLQLLEKAEYLKDLVFKGNDCVGNIVFSNGNVVKVNMQCGDFKTDN